MDKQADKTLGQRISDLRAQKNISQTELAEALDVSRQSISKLGDGCGAARDR